MFLREKSYVVPQARSMKRFRAVEDSAMNADTMVTRKAILRRRFTQSHYCRRCSPKASWQVASGHQQILRSGGLLLIFAFASIESSELRIQETLYCQLENRHAAQACGTAFRLIARDSDC